MEQLTATAPLASHVRGGGRGPWRGVNALPWADGA